MAAERPSPIPISPDLNIDNIQHRIDKITDEAKKNSFNAGTGILDFFGKVQLELFFY